MYIGIVLAQIASLRALGTKNFNYIRDCDRTIQHALNWLNQAKSQWENYIDSRLCVIDKEPNDVYEEISEAKRSSRFQIEETLLKLDTRIVGTFKSKIDHTGGRYDHLGWIQSLTERDSPLT